MRPTRFQDFAVDLLGKTPGVTGVRTLADAGDTKHPWGLAVATPAGEQHWQIIGRLPDGASHNTPDTPVEGTPTPAVAAPEGDSPEAWLAAALAQAECPEIERIERWSSRPDDRADNEGVTVWFHNSARVYVRKL